jgi:diketogulonate reductase-like aldo/keto reductase
MKSECEFDISGTIRMLKELSKKETINWVEEDPWVVDTLRGSVRELGWRGTLTQEVIDNPGQIDSLAKRAIDRLKKLEGWFWKLPPHYNPISGIRIGLGTFGWKYDFDIISEAVADGIIFIDTAETYGYGRVEIALGKVMEELDEVPLVATKVSRSRMSYNSIINAAKRSMEKLGLGRLELYQIHWPNPEYDLGRSMDAMKTLIEEGIIDSVGVCNFCVDQLMDAQSKLEPYPIASVQTRYSLLDRGAERALIPYCQSIGIPVIAYSPLGQDFREFKKAAGWKVLSDVAKRYGASEAQIALAWVRSGEGVIPIPRTNNVNHVLEIAQVASFDLEPGDIEELDEAFPILE